MGPDGRNGVRSKRANHAPALCLAATCLFALPAFGGVEPAGTNPEVFKQGSLLAKLNPGVATRTLRVSPDGQRIAYMATLEDGAEAVFVNDEQSPKYGGIVNDSLSFSPDSRRVAWGALRDGNKVVVVDGKEYPAFNGSAEGMPVWSPDSKRFAFFAATDGDRILAVVDGKAGQPWDSVIKESFVFSSDSTRFAFVAKDGDSGRVVVNGEAGPRYRNVAGFTFSPDGKHFAYVAMFEQSMAVIVDGVEMATGRSFIKDTLRFDGSQQLHVVSLEGNRLIRVQIDLIGLPSAAGPASGGARAPPGNPLPEKQNIPVTLP
jgi:Tol biopolymer transport system component